MNILEMYQRYLTAIHATLAGLIAVTLCVSFFVVRSDHAFVANLDRSSRSQQVSVEATDALKNVDVYRMLVASRQLFRSHTGEQKRSFKVKTIDDLTADLLVVGVVAVDTPEAILKDRRTRQTYFVTVGSRIGELSVAAISEDRVDVTYQNERKELVLR
jgi:hypothetical protein